MYSINAYILELHTNHSLYATIKKGLTSMYSYKPLLTLVGGTGFEPVTSTV